MMNTQRFPELELLARRIIESGASHSEIARISGVSGPTVSNIVNGKTENISLAKMYAIFNGLEYLQAEKDAQ